MVTVPASARAARIGTIRSATASVTPPATSPLRVIFIRSAPSKFLVDRPVNQFRDRVFSRTPRGGRTGVIVPNHYGYPLGRYSRAEPGRPFRSHFNRRLPFARYFAARFALSATVWKFAIAGRSISQVTCPYGDAAGDAPVAVRIGHTAEKSFLQHAAPVCAGCPGRQIRCACRWVRAGAPGPSIVLPDPDAPTIPVATSRRTRKSTPCRI